ncbi:alpha/beta hydrolase [Natranaeroarchaeum aerophilus]|uniref:Dienelactone hydrolase family protein n=1 Tax=Natranaeroarchaeum aerophilus TaxID=2917711 RepID=A0AAE3K494_9EURY|nr:CocE/NonD family hydrolase [Natranaeroarchaeum aerophilus]MCL9812440.1 dienelactone hydrolase family protein [Natranaeroarchaeum aerophilus]
MSESVLVPGGRDVRASLDQDGGASDAVVVACPPHPEHGGSRHDARLTAVSDALVATGIDCLRFDYGPWDGGRGERTDAENAVSWASDRYVRVGLFGYSFGATVALLAAAETQVDAVSALAPTATLGSELDALAALEAIHAPVQVVYGVRDSTVEWESVVERARELGHRTDDLAADHFFVGQHGSVAETVVAFLRESLAEKRTS